MQRASLNLFTFLTLIALRIGHQLPETSVKESQDWPRESGNSTYPYVVEIQHFNASGDFWYFRCVGTILTSKSILTACRCIQDIQLLNLNDVRVLAGGARNSQTVPVKEVLPHPRCQPPAEGHNVALLLLESELVNGQSVDKVKIFNRDPAVAMEEQNRLVAAGELCTTLRWTPLGLKPTKVHLITNKECSQLWCQNNNNYCNDDLEQYNYVCAVGNSPCKGGSGGPLICNDYLFGVDNLCDDKCRVEVPTIFADVNSILYYVDFF